jgi:hypothetical protein
MMRLETVVFPTSKLYRYRRMADVLKLSCAENYPDGRLSIHLVDCADKELFAMARRKCERRFIENARKMKYHAQIIRAAADGELLCMLDCDMMVLRPLEPMPSDDFDLAYTPRPAGSNFRINTGVYWVRVSNALKSFVDAWEHAVQEMLKDEALHHEWRVQHRYGGIHQAAFGYMLQRASGLEIAELPCAEWNCVDGLWALATNPRLVHIMGQLRDCCFRHLRPGSPAMARMVEKWRSYDHRCEAQRLSA